ncbi:hypothetical protein GCM10007079_17170 [Nocardiopsis terrae]|nr:hypothetical protein GCM10007079_17170 [Nocardiopsis terrae]
MNMDQAADTVEESVPTPEGVGTATGSTSPVRGQQSAGVETIGRRTGAQGDGRSRAPRPRPGGPTAGQEKPR